MTISSAATPPSVAPGDRVELRKPHACGGRIWTVYRIGADIGLQCAQCQHRVLLARAVFNQRLRRKLDSQPPDAG